MIGCRAKNQEDPLLKAKLVVLANRSFARAMTQHAMKQLSLAALQRLWLEIYHEREHINHNCRSDSQFLDLIERDREVRASGSSSFRQGKLLERFLYIYIF